MDAALELKIDIDSGKRVSQKKALTKLTGSVLVERLTKKIVDKPLFYVWRLICLSEIPYANHLQYTQNLIDRIYDKLSTGFGFSLSGDEKCFLPCYNAMLISAMCRLGEENSEQVKNAVDWIYTYQPMERGKEISFSKVRFDRYGGCFRNAPCYIGAAKSVFAIFDYEQAIGQKLPSEKLCQGIEYILKHKLVNRLHSAKPITDHILDISFPESYHLNIVELIRFSRRSGIIDDPRAAFAINYLLGKRREDNTWKVDYRYRSEGYAVFDNGGGPTNWVTHVIRSSLNDKLPT